MELRLFTGETVKITDILPDFNDLVKFWNLNNNNPKLNIITYQYTVPYRIEDIFNSIDHHSKSFWVSKNNNKKILSYGRVIQVNDLDEIDTFLENPNKSLTFIGNTSFEKDSEHYFSCDFVLPQLLFISENNQTRAMFNLNLEHTSQYNEIQQNFHKLTNSFKEEDFNKTFKNRLEKVNSIITKSSWEDMVHHSLQKILDNKFEKIVLSRDLEAFYEDRLIPEVYFNELTNIYKSTNSYMFFKKEGEYTFFSFSPEKLFSLNNENLMVDIIAGTAKRNILAKEDKKAGEELLRSWKDLHEHRLVKIDVLNQLEKISQHIQILKSEELLKLPGIQHIYGLISAKKNSETTIKDIVDHLHPTPAVGGHPRGLYQETLAKLEKRHRGPYAAPFGIISNEFTELGVGIRSGVINKNKVHLTSGCGIVAGSQALKEWDETNLKAENLIIKNKTYQNVESTI